MTTEEATEVAEQLEQQVREHEAKAEGKPTATEVMGTLTGYDEIAIEKAFGDDISRIAATSVGKFGRALGFVLVRRGGMSDADAKKHILGLTRREVDDLFADDEVDELPGSEAGKDNS